MATPELDRLHLPNAKALCDPQVPLVVLDLCSVETYLLVQPLTWLASEQDGAIWCPLASPPAPMDLDREAAGHAAERLQLPIAWPARHPEPVPRAMRLAALACEHEAGALCVFGMSRLAFGGGVDLEEPEQHLLAAEEAGVRAQEATLAAQDGAGWDAKLQALAQELRGLGIPAAPALRWEGQLYLGTRAIAPVLSRAPSTQPRLELS
jgi:2-hydroxychromene-2-carboxylate isomerase